MKNFFCFCLVLMSIHAFGQTIEPAGIVNHATYFATPSSISLHSSLGEIATETFSAGQQNLSQGFLQVFTDLTPVEGQYNDLKVKVGPNPCTAYFTIDCNQNTALEAYLFNANGHLIQNIHLTHPRTQINMNLLAAATYFLVIKDKEQQLFKTHKIIKV